MVEFEVDLVRNHDAARSFEKIHRSNLGEVKHRTRVRNDVHQRAAFRC